MRISLNWVKSLLDIEDFGVDTDELVRRLTLHLAEIQGVEEAGPLLDGVVVGRVLACEQHPDADRLSCCQVDIGADEPLPIVCGAPNVAAGQKVPVASVGSTLHMLDAQGKEQSLTIKKGKLRGQPSHGMICAEDELGLGTSHEGILVLDPELPVGAPLRQALGLGDTVLEIDNHNINHRPDLWGHLGWAREIAAILELPAPAAPDISWQDEPGDWSVRIDAPERCFAYCGAVVSGVRQQPSPEWMRARLEACGLRARGLLVDVTNYVMLELGEPMHAFDRRQIAGTRIIVRPAGEGEAFTTLDGREHTLGADDLLIADDSRALALAGIMGGENSAVQDDSTQLVLEAASFQAGGIRRSRIRTGCASDSASRFEKGMYVELCPAAIARAIQLLRASCPELQVQARFHAGAIAGDERTIPLPAAACRRLLGITIPAERQQDLLRRIGCEISAELVHAPWWRRKDLEQTPDLVEEIGRLHGYHQVPAEPPRLPMQAPQPNPLRAAEHRLRQRLSACGWDEVQTYGFTSEEWAAALHWSEAGLIRLEHPLSAEQTVLRASLLPTLLDALRENRKHLSAAAIYEIGKIYGRGFGQGETVDERQLVAGAISDHDDSTPFYAARDAALALLAQLGFTASIEQPPTAPIWAQAGRCAQLRVGKQIVGLVAEISGEIRRHARLAEAAAAFQVELEQLLTQQPAPAPLQFQPVSRYQAVDREFTWICPEAQDYAGLAEASRQAAGSLCQGVELITIYRGDPIPSGHKAVSLQVTLQASDHTLSEKELSKVQTRIIKVVQNKTGAHLR
ncbi:MAG: phenylalanine--tRNA ligase subunit beta [Planctomycetota bacterium]